MNSSLRTPEDATVCGPLDVGDVKGSIPTGPVPAHDVDLARAAATHSPHFDGLPIPPGTIPTTGAVPGDRTIAKVQHRLHEHLDSSLWFDQLRADAGIPAPRLLDHGHVAGETGARWWLVLERVRGQERAAPTPERLQALGAALRGWHERAPHHGLRLDDPGAVGVLLGWFRRCHPATVDELARLFDGVCAGQRVAAIHGDTAVGHNTLYDGDRLSAIIDPGAVHVAPPMLDLAWALAVDEPRGADARHLLDGYGRDAVDPDLLEALRPLLQLRRLVDTRASNLIPEAAWLHDELARNHPELLPLIAS